MTKNIKIGIVGAKFAGGFHADIWKTLPGAEIAAIVDLSEEARGLFQKKYSIEKAFADYRDLIEDPDINVVDICVPNFLHAEIATAALLGGKDVICEKPFATTLEDAEKVADAQAKSGSRFFYAEDWIFAPALQRAETILKSGGIGAPFFFKGKECHNGSHSPFAKKIKFCGGGSIIHLGIHPIGYFQYLLGMPEKVTGCGTGGLEKNFIQKDFEGEDWGLGILHYPSGQKALIEGNYITTGGMDDVIEIYGSDGRIKVDLTFGSPLSVFSKNGIDYAVEKAEFTQGWTRPAVNENESLGYKNELSHFLACLQGKEKQQPGTTSADGYNTFRVIDAFYRSNREGRTVTIA
ncbi:MAG: Gfo/Idh/MocA family oxidoreductase [Treponemataceae bacterium]